MNNPMVDEFALTAVCFGFLRPGEHLSSNELTFYYWAWGVSADRREFELRVCSSYNVPRPAWWKRRWWFWR